MAGLRPTLTKTPSHSNLAVELLMEGKTNRIVCTHDGGFTDIDMDEGLATKKNMQTMEVAVLAAMTGL